jgi:uncharacterized protein (DUF4415 family)
VYLRHTTRRKDGKSHVYWRLVRSVRRGRKIVQETVAQLGELDSEGRARAEELPELTEEMLSRAKVRKGGRPRSPNPRKLISLRLPANVIARCESYGSRLANANGRAPEQG